MALFGWRITYAPTLENSWDAVSAVASWVGVIASFVAIMIAIWIPKKIAKQQDKIALFEKRMECYSTLQNIFAFARQISDAKSKKYIQTAFKLYFGGPDSFPKAQSFTWYTIGLQFTFDRHFDKIYNKDILLHPANMATLLTPLVQL